MGTRKVTLSEKKVLEKLIFPESFDSIMEETGLQYGELRDDLINLMSFGFIEAYVKSGERIILSTFYDSDNLQDFTYRATKKGLSAIKETKKKS